MQDIELLNGISWHLECMVLAATAIDNFRPPADGTQMRMYYSLYLTNLISAIDMVSEFEPKSPDSKFKKALENNLKTSNFSGADVLDYLRELRHGIVHRGVDPTSGGVVIGNVVYATAPEVRNRSNSRHYTAPAHLLRDIFIHCEIGAKPIIERFLEPSIEKVTSAKPEAMLKDMFNAIELVPHMPNWVKEMAYKNTDSEMLIRARTYFIQKLRGLLKPPIGHRIT